MLTLLSGGPRLVTIGPLTSSQTVTIPAGVSNLVTLSGKGQDGTPSYSSTRTNSAQGNSVQGFASGTGSNVGSYSWADFQSDIATVYNNVNAGGTGNGFVVVYQGYPNSNTYNLSLYQYSYNNAVPGTASVFLSPGWKTSGPVLSSDYGFFAVTYTENYTVPATNGADASGFGKTFPGGIAAPATTQNFTNVAVTPGSYSIVVPSGGSITITYYQ